MTENNTLTRAGIAEAVYQQVGLSRNEASDIIEAVLDEICDALLRDETVKISGFGTFSTRQKNARVGRNPKTGVEVTIEPRRVVVFRPSNILKKSVNDENSSSTSSSDFASY